MIGEKRVDIPKLTIAKWKALFGAIETLPNTLVNVLAAKGTEDFTATALVGAEIAIDEVVRIISVVTEVEAEYIEQHADLAELTTFIAKTIEKNDFQTVVKNFRAVASWFTKGKLTDGSNAN